MASSLQRLVPFEEGNRVPPACLSRSGCDRADGAPMWEDLVTEGQSPGDASVAGEGASACRCTGGLCLLGLPACRVCVCVCVCESQEAPCASWLPSSREVLPPLPYPRSHTVPFLVPAGEGASGFPASLRCRGLPVESRRESRKSSSVSTWPHTCPDMGGRGFRGTCTGWG